MSKETDTELVTLIKDFCQEMHVTYPFRYQYCGNPKRQAMKYWGEISYGDIINIEKFCKINNLTFYIIPCSVRNVFIEFVKIS